MEITGGRENIHGSRVGKISLDSEIPETSGRAVSFLVKNLLSETSGAYFSA